jgi:hypothetical protein
VFLGGVLLVSLVALGILQLFRPSSTTYPAPVVMGEPSLMNKKAHGTCQHAFSSVRWNVDKAVADHICCYVGFAEYPNYFLDVPEYMQALRSGKEIQFFDLISQKLLFSAPRGRSMEAFLLESETHGWPAFNNEEVNWENVRVLPGGETVSIDGTHLGHLFVEATGNRFCIDLVCISGEVK